MIPALTVNAANAPPSISHAPRKAELFVGPGRDRRRIAPIVANLGGLLIARFCSSLSRDRQILQRKRERLRRVMRFLMITLESPFYERRLPSTLTRGGGPTSGAR